jgi:hypothetical protein
LALGKNEVLAIPFKTAWYLRIHLLCFQWLFEEFSQAVLEVVDHFVWHTMVDELQDSISTKNNFS